MRLFAAVPAFAAGDIQGRLTILRVDPARAVHDGFRVGDIIEAVDGQQAAARAKRLRPYIAAATNQSATQILDSYPGRPTILPGKNGSIARLTILREGRRLTVASPTLYSTAWMQHSRLLLSATRVYSQTRSCTRHRLRTLRPLRRTVNREHRLFRAGPLDTLEGTHADNRFD
jgi:hypothetical protein